MATKKNLILTYYWPPAGGPGVQRWLKFVKYLPETGIEPIVLTVDPAYAEYPQKDESLMQDVASELKVYKTKCSSVYNLYKKFTKSKSAPYGGFANEAFPTFKQKISRFIRGNFFLPDPRKGWNKYAYRKALQLIDEFQIDTVVTTGPPHSTHLIGLKLKQKIKDIQWLADFRDPWTDIYFYDQLYPTPIARAIDRHYEKNVLVNADVVVTISKHIKQILAEKSPRINAEKIKVIPNGYDESDFMEEAEKENVFTITYTGTTTANYPVDSFLAAVAGLVPEYNIKLRFIGKTDDSTTRKAQQLLGNSVEFIPYVPHAKSIEYIQKASLLLVVIANVKGNKGHLSGKVFEYIGSGNPIICIGPPDGDVAEILHTCHSGEVFESNDKDNMQAYIASCYNNFMNKQVVSNKSYIYPFSRKALTHTLSQILYSIK